MPAVVNINTERVVKRTIRDPYDDFFNNFFGGPTRPTRQIRQKVQSLGSGFIIDPSGYIVTNKHVVERAADLKIQVTMSDGKTYTAKYAGADRVQDIALVKIEGAGPFPFISLTELSPNLLGQTVLAVGNPLGYGLSVSRGILSALNRTITIEDVEYKDLIQTDAAINPGNSGGPLIDLSGKLVGINSVKAAYTPQGVPTQGIGFAVPSATVRDCIQSLLRISTNAPAAPGRKATAGTVTVEEAKPGVRRLFGLQLQNLTEDLSDAFGITSGKGVLISDVEAGSPAERAGLKRGMVLYKVGRFDVNSAQEAEALFEKATPGMVADLLVGVARRVRGEV